jgi:hypothetical protein
VQQLIELLQQQRRTKKVYLSGESGCVELKDDNIIDMPWGITFR